MSRPYFPFDSRQGDGVLQHRRVADVALGQGEELAHKSAFEVLSFSSRIVEVGEVVDGGDLDIAGQKLVGQVGADEAGGAGDCDSFHFKCGSGFFICREKISPRKRCLGSVRIHPYHGNVFFLADNCEAQDFQSIHNSFVWSIYGKLRHRSYIPASATNASRTGDSRSRASSPKLSI